MAIRVSHTPISTYGRVAYRVGRGEAIQRGQELALQREQVTVQQEARNRAFALQEAASRRAERSMMADIERRGRMDLAGFEEMKQTRQVLEQNMADWESLAGTMTEPEYKRGVMSIRSGRMPQALRQAREPGPPKDVYRASDRDALTFMATDYAWQAPEAKGLEWGVPYRNQKDLIEQYKQFLTDNNYSDLNDKDKRMLELQWENAMGEEKKFRWNPASAEVQAAREEMRTDVDSDTKSEVGHYMSFLMQDGGQKAIDEFNRKWANPANRPAMLVTLRERYGNIR